MGLVHKVILFSTLYAIFNVLGAAIIKNKLLSHKILKFSDFIVFLLEPKIFVAIFFIFISMFFSIKALSISSFSSVIPIMTGVNFMITMLVGYLFFKDQLGILGYIGVFIILVGVIMVSKGYAGN